MPDQSLRVIFINRFFYPDHSATSQILSDLAFDLARRGGRVDVITSRQHYSDSSALLQTREFVNGVQVWRVRATTFGRHWLPGRAIDYFTFYLAAVWRLARLVHRSDVVIAKTDPPLLSVAVVPLARAFGFKCVNWLQDIYPEVAGELGVKALSGALGRVLAKFRTYSLLRSALNVVIGEDMARKVQSLGVPANKIQVIPNWTDDDTLVPLHSASPLRKEWQLENKFVVAYSGNLGRAHDAETVLGAAEILKDRRDIVFLFIGGGRTSAALEKRAHERGLNLQFRPYQPRKMLSESLGVADIHWVSLRANVDGLLLPSKFYGIAAAGRPIAVVGSAECEFAHLVTRYDCGFQVDLGQSAQFMKRIAALAADPARCQRLGQNARAMLDLRFTKADALDCWYRTLLQSNDGLSLAGSDPQLDLSRLQRQPPPSHEVQLSGK